MLSQQEILSRWPKRQVLHEIIRECRGNPDLVEPYVISARAALLNVEHNDFLSVSMSCFYLIERLCMCHTAREREIVVEGLLLDFAPEEHARRMERALELENFQIGRPLHLTILPTFYEYLETVAPPSTSEGSDDGQVAERTRARRAKRRRRQPALPTICTTPAPEPSTTSEAHVVIAEALAPYTVEECFSTCGEEVLVSDFLSGITTASTFNAAQHKLGLEPTAPSASGREDLIKRLRQSGVMRTQSRHYNYRSVSGFQQLQEVFKPRWRSRVVPLVTKLWAAFSRNRPPDPPVRRELTESEILFLDSL